MKRSLVVLSFLAVGLLVAYTGANAEVENISPGVGSYLGPNLAHGLQTGRPFLVRPVRAFPLEQQGPVPLPAPMLPGDEAGQRSVSQQSKLGPRASGSEVGVGLSVGGALLAPRGGTMSTPEQQADRAIDRLIRRLN